MINDIREYYCNLTKLQQKKFEVLLLDHYHFEDDSYKMILAIKYLRLYYKIDRGRNFNAIALNDLTEKLNPILEIINEYLNLDIEYFNQVLNPDFNIDYKNTEIYLLDLFQRVFK